MVNVKSELARNLSNWMQHVSFLVLVPALFWSNKEAAVLWDREEPVGPRGSALRSPAHSAPGTDYTGRPNEPGQETPWGLVERDLNLHSEIT